MNLVLIQRDGSLGVTGVALPEAAAAVVAPTVQLYAQRGYVEPWVGYLALKDGCWVGAAGFTSPPVENTVEIAYGTFPGFENRGIATGMAQRLITIAREREPSVKIIAHTLMEENASNHILKKLGFTLSATIDHPEDGQIWQWTYEPQSQRA